MADLASLLAKQYSMSFYGELVDLTIAPAAVLAKGFPPAIYPAHVQGFSSTLVGCVHFKQPKFMVVGDRGDPLKSEECGFPVGTTAWRVGLGDRVTMGAFESFSVEELARDPVRILQSDIYCRVENVRFEAGSIEGTLRARVFVKEWGVTIVDWSHNQDFSVPLTVACMPIFDFGIVRGEVCLQEVDINAHRAKICARGSYNIAGIRGTFAEYCVAVSW